MLWQNDTVAGKIFFMKMIPFLGRFWLLISNPSSSSRKKLMIHQLENIPFHKSLKKNFNLVLFSHHVFNTFPQVSYSTTLKSIKNWYKKVSNTSSFTFHTKSQMQDSWNTIYNWKRHRKHLNLSTNPSTWSDRTICSKDQRKSPKPYKHVNKVWTIRSLSLSLMSPPSLVLSSPHPGFWIYLILTYGE